MQIESTKFMPSRFAPAKINLGLRILRKRNDGYHDIETVFLAVNWCDTLDFEPSDEWLLTCSDTSLATDRSNLALEAAYRFSEELTPVRPYRIHLNKQIAHGAGLGGGSSDAACVLSFLANEAGISAHDHRVKDIAVALGADVPFFLNPVPSVATGKGDVLTPIRNYRFPFYIAIVKPAVSVATADAYQWVTPTEEYEDSLETLVARNNPFVWWKKLINEFEDSVFLQHPTIASLKEGMYRHGAVYASMSGSGSSVFGLFMTQQEARKAARALSENDSVSWFGSAF